MPEFTEGIKTFCKFSLTENNTVKVNLYTKIRIELYLTCLFWLSVILVAIFGKERIPFWIYLILFPVMLISFFYIYRTQEISLQRDVEMFLKKK